MGSLEVCGETARLLYVSWFGKVGDESYHHPHVHAGAYSDGEGCEEQSPSGCDVGQWEVTFVHRLGGLGRRKCAREEEEEEESQKQFGGTSKSDPLFRKKP